MVSAIIGVVAGGGRGRVGDGRLGIGDWRLDGNDVGPRGGSRRDWTKWVRGRVVWCRRNNWRRSFMDRLTSNGPPSAGLRTIVATSLRLLKTPWG